MAIPSIYKRTLPCPPALEFSSLAGKLLFEEALRDGTLNGFFKLIGTFQTQAEPAYCGLTSLSVVLNALSIDPGRQWKGPWRWYDESMLDCCEPLENVKRDGITFSKVACLAECAGASVQAFRSDQSSLNEFRDIVQNCTSSDDRFILVSYDRRKFQQTGTGHFSPLGGYHAGKDMVLILDVARYKYPPHWVPLTLMWDAINTIDSTTGKLRGFMVISKREVPPSLLFTLSCKDNDWRAVCKHLLKDVPEILKTTELVNSEHVMDIVFGLLPADVTSFITWSVEVKPCDAIPTSSNDELVKRSNKIESERLRQKNTLLQQLRKTMAFDLITTWIGSSRSAQHLQVEEDLQDTVLEACCRGAAAFAGFQCSSVIKCITTESVTRPGDNQDVLMTSRFLVNGSEQTIEALIPASHMDGDDDSCKCSTVQHVLQPTRRDLLSVLLLALPTSTWSTISDSKILAKIMDAVATEHLPTDLQLEVAHISRQAIIVSNSYEEEYSKPK